MQGEVLVCSGEARLEHVRDQRFLARPRAVELRLQRRQRVAAILHAAAHRRKPCTRGRRRLRRRRVLAALHLHHVRAVIVAPGARARALRQSMQLGLQLRKVCRLMYKISNRWHTCQQSPVCAHIRRPHAQGTSLNSAATSAGLSCLEAKVPQDMS